MKDPGPLAHLEAMVRPAENAISSIDGMDREEVWAAPPVHEAGAPNLLLNGEAAGCLVRDHPSFVADHAQVPWTRTEGLRNPIAHGYDSPDFNVIWYTGAESLGELLQQNRPLAITPDNS